jgi:hypothetical protein
MVAPLGGVRPNNGFHVGILSVSVTRPPWSACALNGPPFWHLALQISKVALNLFCLQIFFLFFWFLIFVLDPCEVFIFI